MDPKDKTLPDDNQEEAEGVVRSLEDIDENLRAKKPKEEPPPPDKEDTLDDLAKEEIEEETSFDKGLSEAEQAGFTQRPIQPFKTTNVNLEPEEEPQIPPRKVMDEPEEEEGVSEEIHIPNLRSPKLSQNPSFNRPSIDENYQEGGGRMREVPFERGSPVFRQPQRRGGASKVHLLILLIIGIAVIGATVYFLKTQFSGSSSPEPVKQVVTTPTPVPTPVPEPVPDRSKFVIKVLNGTTKAGMAATVSAKLKELGYQTEKGVNAPTQNYQRTEIKAKEGQEALVKQLILDLSPDFDATASGTLKSSSTIDAEIILGLK